MVSGAARAALARLWTDRCTIFVRREVTDRQTHLTDFEEVPLAEDVPCKLSFQTISAAGGDEVASVQQVTKLFLSPDLEVPAGCKIIVTRPNETERTLTYTRSGEAAVFTNHQEIMLELFRRWC